MTSLEVSFQGSENAKERCHGHLPLMNCPINYLMPLTQVQTLLLVSFLWGLLLQYCAVTITSWLVFKIHLIDDLLCPSCQSERWENTVWSMHLKKIKHSQERLKKWCCTVAGNEKNQFLWSSHSPLKFYFCLIFVCNRCACGECPFTRKYSSCKN